VTIIIETPKFPTYLSVVFNTDQKIIFADEEWLSVIITTIIAITFNYQIFKNINILGFGLQNVYILLLTIIATISVIKRGGMISFLSLGIGYIFIRNIVSSLKKQLTIFMFILAKNCHIKR